MGKRSSEGEFLCQYCPKRYKKAARLRKHEESHMNTHLCYHCGEGFVSEDTLMMHEMNHTFEETLVDEVPCKKQKAEVTSIFKEMDTGNVETIQPLPPSPTPMSPTKSPGENQTSQFTQTDTPPQAAGPDPRMFRRGTITPKTATCSHLMTARERAQRGEGERRVGWNLKRISNSVIHRHVVERAYFPDGMLYELRWEEDEFSLYRFLLSPSQ